MYGLKCVRGYRFSAESSRGWVSFKDGIWEECDVTGTDQNNLSLKLADGSNKTFPRKQVLKHSAYPPTSAAVMWLETNSLAKQFTNQHMLEKP